MVHCGQRVRGQSRTTYQRGLGLVFGFSAGNFGGLGSVGELLFEVDGVFGGAPVPLLPLPWPDILDVEVVEYLIIWLN